MTLPDSTRIAGTKTAADWKALRVRLESCKTEPLWEEAFEDFLKARLDSRYFGPVKAIEGMKLSEGEGFAIVTLHCSLIEFLATTILGKTFRDKNADPKNHEYGRGESKNLFVEFLKTNEPFKNMFSQDGQAEDFYSNVRCGLLHEAQTRAGWRIRVCPSASMAIDTFKKVVYRDKMQAAFDQFLEWYKSELAQNCNFQEAFIRKFNGLCEE
jgi:hypothetical protein